MEHVCLCGCGFSSLGIFSSFEASTLVRSSYQIRGFPQCEALYLLGVQLLTAEHIDGATRERLLVAHHRGAVQTPAASCHLDDVCKLLRSTGLGETGRRPPHYPDHYFRWEPDVS